MLKLTWKKDYQLGLYYTKINGNVIEIHGENAFYVPCLGITFQHLTNAVIALLEREKKWKQLQKA